MTESWMDEAACRRRPLEHFFIEQPNTRSGRLAVTAAKATCASCTVADRCLAYAETNFIGYGIWGGLMPDERRNAPKKRIGPEKRHARRAAVLELAGKGMDTAHIAAVVGVSERTVYRLVKAHS